MWQYRGQYDRSKATVLLMHTKGLTAHEYSLFCAVKRVAKN